ncbi:Fe(3+) ABC transporter substrate-binding protein [Denitromonas iodatirespirans]|uniref:Fe(3+) ABC transporter substrate-binding protein n=1 Tax=Denitromonas iodatirespirans TaxID=2795389 RepID=A0A944HBA1_DENI1|nr:Fe(3+) ABC transporter substrate-binding protein [Denitromonas iodatirespirans]MBT0961447.1 Fe(3+) ABC transporter substrate-binding protein [Denitromonas iodatirespirans]
MKRSLAAPLLCALLAASVAHAEDKVLNLYTARHYQTDEALYNNFTKATGIKINRIEGKEDALLERIRSEGENSPADVFITVDASRLAKADAAGVFAPVKSETLASRIPANLRTDTWFAFSTRARVIVYNKANVKAEQVQNYEDLANPALKGKVCTRSGSHPYNLSLGAAMIQHLGVEKTEAWAKGIVANFAREPKGGDTDQIRAVAAGECGVAIANSYYVARLINSDKPEDKQVMEAVGVVWPNQKGVGTHINVSGGGMLKHAPHKASAVAFLEYLASDEAQRYFADGNNEWPVVQSVKVSNPALERLGSFKADALPVGKLADTVAEAQKAYDRAGYR